MEPGYGYGIRIWLWNQDMVMESGSGKVGREV